MKEKQDDFDGQMNLFDVIAQPAGDMTELIIEEKPKKKTKKSQNENTDKKQETKKKPKTAQQEIEEPLVEEVADFYPVKEKAERMHAVMHRTYEDELSKEKIVAAYIDYNRIYYKDKKKKPVLMQFKNSKLAVDYYIDLVEKLEKTEDLVEKDIELELLDV